MDSIQFLDRIPCSTKSLRLMTAFLLIIGLLVTAEAQNDNSQQKEGKYEGNTGVNPKKKTRRGGKTFKNTVWVKPASFKLPEHCSYEKYYSKAMDHDVGYVIFIPPQYENSNKPLPVIYFLHGKGGDEIGASRKSVYLNQAILKNVIRPCLAVYINGAVSAMYSDSYDGKYMMETTFINELIPHIEGKYKVIKEAKGRCIEGFSMGGHGTTKFAIKYPDMFCSALVYGPALLKPETFKKIQPLEYESLFNSDDSLYLENSPWDLISTHKENFIKSKIQYKIFGGTLDPSGRGGRKFHEYLTELNIPSEYEEVEGVGHNMKLYLEALGAKGYAFHEKNLKTAKYK